MGQFVCVRVFSVVVILSRCGLTGVCCEVCIIGCSWIGLCFGVLVVSVGVDGPDIVCRCAAR